MRDGEKGSTACMVDRVAVEEMRPMQIGWCVADGCAGG
jgi:hypothetical protein